MWQIYHDIIDLLLQWLEEYDCSIWVIYYDNYLELLYQSIPHAIIKYTMYTYS